MRNFIQHFTTKNALNGTKRKISCCQISIKLFSSASKIIFFFSYLFLVQHLESGLKHSKQMLFCISLHCNISTSWKSTTAGKQPCVKSILNKFSSFPLFFYVVACTFNCKKIKQITIVQKFYCIHFH